MASEVTSKSDKRIFPPLYVQTGDISKDRLAFIHILERLKVRARYLILRLILKVLLRGLIRRKKEQDGLNIMYAVQKMVFIP